MHKDILHSYSGINSTIYGKQTWQRMIYNIYEKKEGRKKEKKGGREGMRVIRI